MFPDAPPPLGMEGKLGPSGWVEVVWRALVMGMGRVKSRPQTATPLAQRRLSKSRNHNPPPENYPGKAT
eukprot:7427475-Pyramimonas_sp.AAC.1